MTFLKFATRTLRSVPARHFSTAAPGNNGGGPTKLSKNNNNLPFFLGGAGLAGLATYIYLAGSVGTPSKPKYEKSALDSERFLDLKLKAVEPYNHNTSRFIFELPNGTGAALSPVTSLVVVRASEGAGGASDAPVDKKGNLAVRAYTPISSPEHEGELVLLIKKYENGVISKYVHERLKPGDTLAIKGPIPKFPYKANEFEHVALIGGGSGITPLYQLLSHALKDPTNQTRFTLLYANVSEADILLRDELSVLEREHPDRLRVVHTLDQPSSSTGWTGAVGYVSRELVKTHVPPADLGDKIKVLVCGPPGQVNAVAGKKDGPKQGQIGGILKELGYTEDQVFKF
ncbi:ferredoxin reductase-like C-terminal NADP-linked domain-containing protein [Multifurca ochricompacta]|uniref:NADH-cytochrome b5 reductase n=1 Tax=Multifurca ochricompacta TaxID=376703 RepID=A0AAD4LZI4_9AGAM|nr:ferredoxin reductase-like C-terminal NADP-linked domain-containing protein [Multifurca ochricompacta]